MLDPDSHRASTSDRDLIAQAANGDRPAFERLVERHAAAVLRLATAITGDRASAEDAMQQAFLQAYRNAAGFRAEASVRTWLLTIARNAAHRLVSKRDREERMEERLMKLGLQAGWGSNNPEALAIAAEHRDILRAALRTLCSEDQEVLILRDVEGLRGPEAAEVLEIGEQALKSRLHRARLRLAVALRATSHPKAAGDSGGQR